LLLRIKLGNNRMAS